VALPKRSTFEELKPLKMKSMVEIELKRREKIVDRR
jgi:hypothetical protein